MNDLLVKEFYYNASKEEVWNALIDTEKMKQWYFPQLRKFEPLVGYQFQFNDDDSEYQKKWTVTRIEEQNIFAHSWAYKGYPGTSEVVFELFAEKDKIKLIVTQTGLESFPKDPHFTRERFASGWENLLGRNFRKIVENHRTS